MKITTTLTLLLAACGTTTDNLAPSTNAVAQAAKRRDAAVIDAPLTYDASPGPTPGLVTCYSSAAPGAECTLASTYCCWTTYSSPPFGSCVANGSSCVHSDEHCDGPEDCAIGQSCYAHSWSDATDVLHWTVACAASPTAPTDRVLCRVGGTACPDGKTCVTSTTAGIYDMMTTQYVCN